MKLFLYNVITRFLCWVGIHRWKTDIVMTKKKWEHCKGAEEMNHDKEEHWHNGRSCYDCKQEQYFWYHITVMGWQNVL